MASHANQIDQEGHDSGHVSHSSLMHVMLAILLLFISYVHKLMVQGILRLEWIYKCICVRGKKLGAPGEKVPRTERI